MLDYAANGVAYWPIDQIIDAFNVTVTKDGGDPEQRLRQFLQEQEPEPFWRQVEANLRSGRIRMVFVADRIYAELRRIMEFLNEQMRPAEVLAIEIAQFTAGDTRLLAPKLIGATSAHLPRRLLRKQSPRSKRTIGLTPFGNRKAKKLALNAG